MIQQQAAKQLASTLTKIYKSQFFFSIKPETEDPEEEEPGPVAAEAEEKKDPSGPIVKVVSNVKISRKLKKKLSKPPKIKTKKPALFSMLSNITSLRPQDLLFRPKRIELNRELMRMGDIISFSSSTDTLIIADGFSSSSILTVHRNFIKSSGSSIRQVLFRIDPPYEYCDLSPIQPPIDSSEEVETNMGRPVVYGEKVLLRHINSQSLFTCSDTAGDIPGSLKITLNNRGNEGSLIEFCSISALRKTGEAIMYSDIVRLVIYKNRTFHYVHSLPDSGQDLLLHSVPTDWNVERFCTMTELKANSKYIVTGNCLRIFHPKFKGYLSIRNRSAEDVLIDKEEKSMNAIKRNFLRSLTSIITIETRKTCMSIWELEKAYPFEGGPVKWDERYRLKNLATGHYLTVKEGQHFALSETSENESVFIIRAESQTPPFVSFDSLFILENEHLNKFVNVEQQKTEFAIRLRENLESKESFSFLFVDEPEENVQFIYQINAVIVQVREMYGFLMDWKTDIVLETQKEEENLRLLANATTDTLTNLRECVLGNDNIDLKIKERQNAVCDTGLLGTLIKLVQLIDSKQQVPGELDKSDLPPHISKSDTKTLKEIHYRKFTEFRNWSQVIANPILIGLSMQIYQSVFTLINDNYYCSRSILQYDIFLSSQLQSYRIHVGRILKEIYMYTGSIASQSDLWTKLLMPINEIEKNYEEQIISLKILSSLCTDKEEGVPWFQTSTSKLLFEQEFRFVMFLVLNDRACVKISGGSSLSLSDFLTTNPKLAELAIVNQLNAEEPNLFYLDRLSSHSKLCVYLAAYLKLLANLCLSRNEEAAEFIIINLSLTFDHILLAIKNHKVHAKIRASYLMLCRVLFIDRSMSTSISETPMSCYLVSPSFEIESDKGLEQSVSSAAPYMYERISNIDELVNWVRQIWVDPDFPTDNYRGLFSAEPEGLNDLLKTCKSIRMGQTQKKPKDSVYKFYIEFVIELIKITEMLIEFKHAGFDLIRDCFRPLFTLMNSSNTSDVYGNHWTHTLRQGCTKKDFMAYEKLIVAGLHLLTQGFQLQTREIAKNTLAQLLRYGEAIDPRTAIERSVGLYDFSNRHALQPIVIARVRQVVPVGETLSIEINLLHLLFYSGNSAIKKLSLDLLVFILTRRSNLLKTLGNSLLFIDDREMITEFVNVFYKFRMSFSAVKFISNSFEQNYEDLNDSLDFKRARNLFLSNFASLNSAILLFSRKQMPEVQQVLFNIGAVSSILELFTKNWVWIVDGRVMPIMTEIYKEAVMALQHFCKHNLKHKRTLFENFTHFVQFIEDGIGISKLLADLVACDRHSEKVQYLIQKLIQRTETNENPQESYLDLKILINLVVDINERYFIVNQEQAAKTILNSHSIVGNIRSKYNDISLMRPADIKFWKLQLVFLSLISSHNYFVTAQVRRLLPFQNLVKELKNPSIPYSLKKAYLHAIYHIHCMADGEVTPDLPISVLEDVLYSVVLPDIERHSRYIKHIDYVCSFNLYRVCPVLDPNKLIERKSVETTKNIVVAMVSGKDGNGPASLDKFNKDQLESLDYFKFVSSAVPHKPQVCTGLLCFIRSITDSLKNIREDNVTADLAHTLDNIRLELQLFYNEFHDKVFKIKHEILFTNLLEEVLQTIFEIPSFYIEGVESNAKDDKEDLDQYYVLFDRIVSYIDKNFLEVTTFIKMLDLDTNLCAYKIDISRKLKDLLEDTINMASIHRALKILPVENLNTKINAAPLIESIKLHYETNSHVVKKQRYKSNLTKEETRVDLNEKIRNCVQKVKIYDTDVDLKKFVKTLIVYGYRDRMFFVNLQNSFSEEYLIKVLYYILNAEVVKKPRNRYIDLISSVKANRSRNLTRAQTTCQLYVEIGILETIISHILNSSSKSKAKLSLDLLILMLRTNNLTVKSKILTFDNSELLLFIRYKIRTVRDILYMRHKTSVNPSVIDLDHKDTIVFTTNLYTFLQLCCDNCYLPFQSYLREQPVDSSINIVEETGNFITHLPKLPELKQSSNEVVGVVKQCIECLSEMCMACLENQEIVGKKPQLYSVLNWILFNDYPLSTAWVSLVNVSLKLLKSLIEGSVKLQVPILMRKGIFSDRLFNLALRIYDSIIAGRENFVLLEYRTHSVRLCEREAIPLTEFEDLAIETGFDCCILDNYINLLHCKKSPRRIDFYSKNTCSVELCKETIAPLFFRMPPICQFLTVKSRKELIEKVYHLNRRERLEKLVAHSYRCEVEMQYHQSLAKYPFINAISSRWETFSTASFFLLLLMNIIMLMSIQHDSGRTGSWSYSSLEAEYLNNTLAVFQAVLGILIFVGYMIEYFPVIIYKKTTASYLEQLEEFSKPMYDRIKGTKLMERILGLVNDQFKVSMSQILLKSYVIMTSPICIYYFAYMIISIVGISESLYTSLLLLSLVKRSEVLVNVLRSLTQNWTQLLLTMVLGLFVMYIFAFSAYLIFPEDFVEGDEVNTYCHSLYTCIISTGLIGVRTGGGIGGALAKRTIDDSLYYFRLYFDYFYFAIIILLFLNLVFGIIIQTFGELRDLRNENERSKKETCFVCGKNKSEFEIKRINWRYHVNIEHSVHSYLYLLIYIRRKPIEECNGLEKHVKECLRKGDCSFFPDTSFSLLNSRYLFDSYNLSVPK